MLDRIATTILELTELPEHSIHVQQYFELSALQHLWKYMLLKFQTCLILLLPSTHSHIQLPCQPALSPKTHKPIEVQTPILCFKMWAVENMNSNRFVAGAGIQSFGQVDVECLVKILKLTSILDIKTTKPSLSSLQWISYSSNYKEYENLKMVAIQS